MPLDPNLEKAADRYQKSGDAWGLSNIQPEQWKEMGNAFTKMTEFVAMGGFSMISAGIDNVMGRLKDQVANGVESALAPITGELMVAANDVFSEIGKLIKDFTDGLDGISVTLPSTGQEISLLDQSINALKATSFGLFSFLPSMVHQFQIMVQEIKFAEAAANAAAVAQRKVNEFTKSKPRGGKIMDIERGLM
ncbi:hypothetical protein [Pseudoalteromonas sp.]|uniref:hypothetical protein n=1 Tax=Pseudoalteromonas sp. TaxID=53249 RepID=UPI0026381CB1|nr:hypothetical protein [Pseudoalteromonas sp.]MCP4585302.1 hypothetical protein [Pseudoalteromonas sp.]